MSSGKQFQLRSLFVATCLFAGLALAQDNDVVFRTETRIVEVTVIAVDGGGQPVPDLTIDEVQLFDNGIEQQIQTFYPVGTFSEAARRDPNTPAKKAPRHTIILLDALNSSFGDQAHVRSALAKVFRDFVADEDRIAIFVLSNRLKMLHDFTQDAASLETIARVLSGEAAAGDVRAYSTDGESVEFTLEDIFAEPDRARNRVEADLLLQRRVLTTFDALSSIAKGTAQIPGQKNLIWLSAAFPLMSWSSTRNPTGGVSSIGPSLSFTREADRMASQLNAANMNLYAVDARGLSVSSNAHINIATMRRFAVQTGGKVYANNNDLVSSVRSAIDDSRVGYVLTYSPSDYGEDGKRHDIKMRTSRKDVTLRHRPGYSALNSATSQ